MYWLRTIRGAHEGHLEVDGAHVTHLSVPRKEGRREGANGTLDPFAGTIGSPNEGDVSAT